MVGIKQQEGNGLIRYKCRSCGGNQYTSNCKASGEPCMYCGKRGLSKMDTLEEAHEKRDGND